MNKLYKTLFAGSVTLLGMQSQLLNAEENYPAPPGVYGNESLFSEFQQKASAETSSVLPEVPAEQKTAPQTAISPASPVPLIFAQPNTPAPEPVITGHATTTFEQSQSLPAAAANFQQVPPAPATAEASSENPFIPDAGELHQKMQAAAGLAFDQWGQALNQEPQSIPVQINPYYYGPELFQQIGTSVNDQLFDNPYPVGQQQPRQSYQPSPGHFNFDTGNYAQQRQPAYLPDYPAPSLPDYGYEPGNYGYDSYNQVPSYTQPPTPNFAPPPDMTRPMPQQQFGNQQYFRKIPSDDIIYPPNYPGNR